jgi:hypothetical protein
MESSQAPFLPRLFASPKNRLESSILLLAFGSEAVPAPQPDFVALDSVEIKKPIIVTTKGKTNVSFG